MATSPAQITDLVARSLRTLTPAELSAAPTYLADAFIEIATRVSSIPGRLDLNEPGLADLIIRTQCAMVSRYLTNPDGLLEESGDDYMVRRDSATSTGTLYLSDREYALLTANTPSSDGSFTIRPAGRPHHQHFGGHW